MGAIYDALTGSGNCGLDWQLPHPDNPTPDTAGKDQQGSVDVRLVNNPLNPNDSNLSGSDFAQILGSWYDPTNTSSVYGALNGQDYIYQITFQGELHDAPVSMAMDPNNPPTLLIDTTKAKQQILHFGTPSGYFDLAMNGSTTADIAGSGTPTVMAANIAAPWPTFQVASA